VQAGHDFRQQGFVGRTMPEIRSDCLDQRRLMAGQHIAQGVQPTQAILFRVHRCGGEGRTLAGE